MKRRAIVVTLSLLSTIACLAVWQFGSRAAQNVRRDSVVRALHAIGVGIHNRRDAGSGTWVPRSASVEQRADSWRYAILPFLESVSEEFFQTSWRDGRYADYAHPLYCLTNHRNPRAEYTTNCLAVIGNGTLADSALDVFEQDAILVLAVGDTDIGWGEIGDLQVDQQGNLLSDWPGPVFGKWVGVLFADGRVWLLDADVPTDELSRFFSVDGAKTHDADEVLGPYRAHGEPFGG